MAPTDWTAKFPALRRVHSDPSHWNVNGCGFFFAGRRDADQETRSFIQTRWLCILGIPILALGAYRFVATDEEKYILGREPLSVPVQAFNALLLIAVLGLAGFYGWTKYTGTPEYLARQQLIQADQWAAAGKVAEAARLCRAVAQGPGSAGVIHQAVRRVATLLEHPVARGSAAEQAGILEVAVALARAGRWPEPSETLYHRGRALVDQHAASQPVGALAILEAAAPLAPKDEDLNALRRSLLVPLAAAHPDDPELASRLAVVYEAQGQDDRCAPLLEPLRDRLGTTEGARILGLADARRGHVDQALALLRPYTHTRLEAFHAAEAALTAARKALQRRIAAQIKSGQPADFDLVRFIKATEAEQDAQLGRYLTAKLKADPAIVQAQDRLLHESSVVPVALELGMILVQHAQSLADPRARQDGLDEAEKVFLAVGSLAEESDAYRLNLAQVYYWQGKHREGRALFDEVLKARNREPKLLVQVSELLRRVGSMSEARALAEEAYQAGRDAQVKQQAAIERGVLGGDPDDRILWLRRGNPTESHVKALLSSDLAYQALSQGDEAAAIAHLRDALELYNSMPETSSNLNNSAMDLFRLAALTGEPAAFDRGLARIEKAYKLDPSDSVTMINAGNFLLEESLRDILGRSIDLGLLKEEADIDTMAFLYRDAAGRVQYAQRLRSHPGINRAIAMLDKGLLLAPRRGALYKALNEVYGYRDEVEKQRDLLHRLERADLDQSDELALGRDGYSGRRDDRTRARMTAAIARAESALKAARARKRDPTFAVAAANLSQARMSGSRIGLEADTGAIVALAEEADAAAPSHGTRHLLVVALLFRAGRRLDRSQPAYAKLSEKTRHSSSDPYLIGVALGRDDPLRDAARQDADVRRAVDLIRAAYRDDPKYPAGSWTWSLLRAFHADEAAKMAQTFLRDESQRISRAIQRRVEPVSAAAALSSYWAAEMAGQAAEARAVLKEFAARGVPLPIESP